VITRTDKGFTEERKHRVGFVPMTGRAQQKQPQPR